MRVTVRPLQVRFGRDLRRRLHHAPVGAALVVLGAALVASDWDDRRIWIRDLRGR